MSVRADAETLRHIPIFAGCDSIPLQLLAFSAERRHFAVGDYLLSRGEIGVAAYLVLSGRAEIRSGKGSLNGTIGHAEPGAFLGEVAMIAKAPCSVSAVAVSPLTAAQIDRDLFIRVAEEYPEFAEAVFKALAGKLDLSLSEFNAAREMLMRARSFLDL
jgi:CRP/FNR family transcriptional regulator, cyclic AMP receptor protein